MTTEADKLAEALRDARKWVWQLTGVIDNSERITKINDALAAYDASRRKGEQHSAPRMAVIDELLHHIRNCTHCRWCRLETRDDVISALESFAATHAGDEQMARRIAEQDA